MREQQQWPALVEPLGTSTPTKQESFHGSLESWTPDARFILEVPNSALGSKCKAFQNSANKTLLHQVTLLLAKYPASQVVNQTQKRCRANTEGFGQFSLLLEIATRLRMGAGQTVRFLANKA
eukprot:245078-Pelagomonas_calceolata.AAC.6